MEKKLRSPEEAEAELQKRLAEASIARVEADMKEEPVEIEEEEKKPSAEEVMELEKEKVKLQLEEMGCPASHITKYKEKYGTVIVYPHEEEKWYVLRPILVSEMKMIRKITPPEELDDTILMQGVIFPLLDKSDVDKMPAGLPSLLVNMITRLSGFIPLDLAFSLSREL